MQPRVYSHRASRGYSIIGVLSSIVLASLTTARDKANYAAAAAEMNQIVTAMRAAQIETGQVLGHVTEQHLIGDPNEYCTGCPCGVATGQTRGFIRPAAGRINRSAALADLRNIPETDQCYVWWDRALTLIKAKADGLADNADGWDRDPWGSPYILDENELEPSGSVQCRNDTIRSAGKDGIFSSWSGVGSDDFIVVLPLSTSQCN